MTREVRLVPLVPEGTECPHMLTFGCSRCHRPQAERNAALLAYLDDDHRGARELGGERKPAQRMPSWDALAEMAQVRMRPEVTATYSDDCPACGRYVRAGDPLRYSEEEGKYVCQGCAGQA